MTIRAEINQVKFKIRYNSLLLKKFTVAEMIRATGLNPESVRTEIQRMKREGLLSTEVVEKGSKNRGGQPVLYRLTDDPEARLALSESIEAFYPALNHDDKPTSRHFFYAQELLNQALSLDELQREQILFEVEDNIDIAEQTEGGSLASARIKAYILYERARLAYLKNNRAEAKSLFAALREFFIKNHDELMVRRIDEFQLCIESWDHFMRNGPTSLSEIGWGRCLLDTVKQSTYLSDNPLMLLFIRSLTQLTQTADDRVRAAAFDLAADVSRREMNPERHELIYHRQSHLFREEIQIPTPDRILAPESPQGDGFELMIIEEWMKG